MAANKSSLSAGEIIRQMLVSSESVTTITSKIYPIVDDEARLPYIVYRRTGMEQVPTKFGRGADTITIEVLCFTEHYTEGVELAEAVRDALDGNTGEADGLVMRSCYLTDSEEAWQDDAFVQQLIFKVKL